MFTATIKKTQDGLLILVDDNTSEILGEVFEPTEEETDFDMSMLGYRKIKEGYFIDAGCRVPDSVSVAIR